jgi:hypothetical protein
MYILPHGASRDTYRNALACPTLFSLVTLTVAGGRVGRISTDIPVLRLSWLSLR